MLSHVTPCLQDGVRYPSLWMTGWTDALTAGNWCYESTRAKLTKTRFERGLKTASPCFREIWRLIVGFTLWYVWKSHCLKVFQDPVRPREELTMDIWFAIISCLRGQLAKVCCHSDDLVIARLRFWQKWRNMPMVMQEGNDSNSNYQPPRWLFPTHLPPSLRWRLEDQVCVGQQWLFIALYTCLR